VLSRSLGEPEVPGPVDGPGEGVPGALGDAPVPPGEPGLVDGLPVPPLGAEVPLPDVPLPDVPLPDVPLPDVPLPVPPAPVPPAPVPPPVCAAASAGARPMTMTKLARSNFFIVHASVVFGYDCNLSKAAARHTEFENARY
jgi:hypothetical protein